MTDMALDTIEFESPVPGGGTRRQSGRVLEHLPEGKVRVEILVGGEPTTMIIRPDTGNGTTGKPERKRARKEPVPPRQSDMQPNLFDSAIAELKQQVDELKARIPVPRDTTDEPHGDDITPDTIIEPVMYREDILGPKPKYRTIQRHHVGDSRYYVQQFEQPDGQWSRPELYAGVTSISKAVLPRNKNIEKWMCSFPTYDDAILELNKLAARGTVMHSMFAMCMDGTLPDFGTSEFDRVLRGQISRQLEGLGVTTDEVFGEWRHFICKAILGFKQFMYDHNVEVLAIEVVLGTPTVRYPDGSKPLFGYFFQVDLICILDWKFPGFHGEVYKSGPNKGKPKRTTITKRVVGIGDFKSGDSDYPDHTMQLELQLPVVQQTFPHLDWKDAVIFNWHPSKYRESKLAEMAAEDNAEPAGENEDENESSLEFGYRVINKTGKMPRGWAQDHLWLWQKYHAQELPMKMVFQGSPNIDVKPSQNVRFEDYASYWEEKATIATRRGFIKVD
jgi:hypothetical protein